MEQVFIELRALATKQSLAALREVAQLCASFWEEHGLHADFLDEEYSPAGQWCYLVLMICGNGVQAKISDALHIPDELGKALASCTICSDPDPAESAINEDELLVTYYRPNLPDSQFIACTNSNVEIKHGASGIVVRAQSDRSRRRNYVNAISFLRSKLRKPS